MSALKADKMLWSDDFEDYTVSGAPTELPAGKTDTSRWWSVQNDTDRRVLVDKDSARHFGPGASNQILLLNRTANATADLNLSTTTFSPTTTAILSFDFHVKKEGLSSDNKGYFLRIMSDVTTGDYATYDGSHVLTGFYISTGASGGTISLKEGGNSSTPNSTEKFSFAPGKENTLLLVINNSNEAVRYDGDSLDAGRVRVYLNGKEQATWNIEPGTATGLGKEFNGLWMQLPSGVTGEIQFDNFQVKPISAFRK